MAGLQVLIKGLRVTVNYLKDAREGFDNSMCAAAFAEAGCPDLAKEMMLSRNVSRTEERSPQSLQVFLNDVGLTGVRVRYCFAHA